MDRYEVERIAKDEADRVFFDLERRIEDLERKMRDDYRELHEEIDNAIQAHLQYHHETA